MKRIIHTEIIINAPSIHVWKTLINLDSYTQWNPFIQKASGEIGLGKKISVTPKLSEHEFFNRPFNPTIVRYVLGKEFAWTGKDIHPAIFLDEHIFILEEIGENKTKLIHDEYFFGVFSPIVMAIGGKKTQQGFVDMNEALKSTIENQIPAK